MRVVEEYELEHRGPLVFSRTAAVVLLVAIFSGAFSALVIRSDIRSFIPLFMLTVATALAAFAGIRFGAREKRFYKPVSATPPDQLEPELIGDIKEFLETSSTLIGIVDIQNESLRHVYDNPAASRFFALSPDARSNHSGTPRALKSVESLLYEQCLEGKARNSAVSFEFMTERVGQQRWFSTSVFPLRDGPKGSNRFAYHAENITSVKENETALAEARERLAAALEAGSLATWDWDIRRDVVYGDAVLMDLYGLPPEYVRGATSNRFLDHIHQDDRDRIQMQINKALESGGIYSEQYRIIGKGGKTRWVSATGRVISDTSGRPGRFPGVTIDITPLKETEAALRQATVASTNQLRELESVYTYAPVGLAVVDAECRWQRANKVMAEYFGKNPADFIGKSLYEVVPTVANGFDGHLHKVIETRAPVLNVEVSGECPITPGSIRTWNTNFYPLINSDNHVVGVNVVTEDITENKRAVEEHRAHRSILGVVSPQGSLETVLNSLTEAVEGIFPGAVSYILHDTKALEPVRPLLSRAHKAVEAIFSSPLSAEDSKVLTDVIDNRRELLISDLTPYRDRPFLGRVRQAGFISCWIKPIVLSDGVVWGACAIHHPTIRQQPTLSEREHLDVLIRLVATVIEHKAFLDRLSATTERLQYAERVGRIGVFDWDPQTGKTVWTPQLEESFGLAAGTFEGTYEAWKKKVHPDDLQKTTDHILRLMACQEKSLTIEYRIITPGGDVRWIHAQGELSYDQTGVARRAIGVAIDVTERKRIEEQGRVIRERLNLALEAGNLGLWDWHIPSGAVQFGGNWASMLGYDANEIEPHVRAWETLVHPDDKKEVDRELARHLAGETPIYEVEHRLRTKSGAWMWILDRGQVVERDPEGHPIRAVGIHADIHEQRMIRERLNSEGKRKDEFIATLAHELRNPLAPIRTGLEVIRRDPGGAAASQTREMMERQLIHMVRLIEDLLDISRISLGRLELRKEKVTLRQIVEMALESSRPVIEAAMHELSVNLPCDEIYLQGDIARLSQVVANLLINSAKYTPPTGKITLNAHVADSYGIIQVVDTGMGIPVDKLTEIFEMFSQVHSPLDRTQGGLGIGLALVKRLVQMHGGMVYAESKGLGQGSTFTVKLPLEVEKQLSIETGLNEKDSSSGR